MMTSVSAKLSSTNPFRPFSRNIVKSAAAAMMLLSHGADLLLPYGSSLTRCLNALGSFTAAVMCYFLTEGFHHTRSKKKYGQRLFLFALLSEIPYPLAFPKSSCPINMIGTLFICFLILVLRERIMDWNLRILLETFLVLATLKADWSVLAPVFVILCDMGRENPKKIWNAHLILIVAAASFAFLENLHQYPPLYALLYAVGSCTGILLSAITIRYFYNGKQTGRGNGFSKWFFYVFYPAHLLILSRIRQIF